MQQQLGSVENVVNESSIPSEFSNLVNRMHQIFSQFNYQEADDELLEYSDNSQVREEDVKIGIGP
jgi:hypothetical protein